MKTLEFKAKEPVKLRIKSIKNGNRSLYLDIYHKGKRKYEFLRLYLIPEHCKEDRLRNRRTLQMAHSIRLGRLAEIQRSLYLEQQSFCKQRSNLLDHIDRFTQNRKKAYRNLSFGLKNHLVQYKGSYIPFCHINKSFLVGFHQYLNHTHARGNLSKQVGRPLSQGTRWNYFNILSRLLNKACREGYLTTNPMHELAANERPRRAEPRKTYLTIHEVRRLADTPFPKHPEVRQAFLFACLCGLRFSDVRRLKWCNLHTDSHGEMVAEIVQQKTGSLLYLPISDEARKQLPSPSTPEDRVFRHLPDASYTCKLLKQWTRAAGVRKHVTFHVARHTFATLSLTYGAELYTISKLLGHSSIRVTQIYAEIISEKKREAVDAIPPIGGK